MLEVSCKNAHVSQVAGGDQGEGEGLIIRFLA